MSSALELRKVRAELEIASKLEPRSERQLYARPMALLEYGERRRQLLQARGYTVETGSVVGGRDGYRWDSAGEAAEKLLDQEIAREEREAAITSERRKRQADAERIAEKLPQDAPKRRPGAPWVFGG